MYFLLEAMKTRKNISNFTVNQRYFRIMHVLSLFFADFQLFSPKCLTIYIYIYTGMYEFARLQAHFIHFLLYGGT